MLLVADDEPRQRRFIVKTIRELRPDVKILEAGNGQEALKMVKKQPVACIISDIRMPLMDGLEFIGECRKIREDILVIFLSAYPDFEYAQQAIRMGAIDYVIKPVNQAIIKTMLEKLEKMEQKIGVYQTFSDSAEEADRFEMEKTMAAIRDYINVHYMENLSRDEIAERFHFSSSYFSIMFKKSFDVTFSEYLTGVRMEKAVDMLKFGNDTISEIAQKVGYHDVKYFLRVFKKVYKCTPKDYRHTRSDT